MRHQRWRFLSLLNRFKGKGLSKVKGSRDKDNKVSSRDKDEARGEDKVALDKEVLGKGVPDKDVLREALPEDNRRVAADNKQADNGAIANRLNDESHQSSKLWTPTVIRSSLAKKSRTPTAR